MRYLDKRLSREEGLELLKNADLKVLGKMANEAKKHIHTNNIVSFIVDRNINYTNICWVDCKFCAFRRKKNDKDAYILTFDEIDQKIDELRAIGGTQILFQGGVHPNLKIEWYEDLVRHISEKYDDVTIHGFSAIEVDYIAKISKLELKEVLLRLQKAGLASIPGAGAEILSDKVRDKIAPKKLDSSRWIEVHKEAHKIGMKSTATMMYGSLENDEDVIEHLDLIREAQDETGGFRAFISWSFQPTNTELQAESTYKMYPVSPNRYLRILAVARLYLDNFKNFQASWVTQGSEIGQLALRFGANDMGGIMMEENVVAAANTRHQTTEEKIIHLIRELDFKPAKRDTAYNILKEY